MGYEKILGILLEDPRVDPSGLQTAMDEAASSNMEIIRILLQDKR